MLHSKIHIRSKKLHRRYRLLPPSIASSSKLYYSVTRYSQSRGKLPSRLAELPPLPHRRVWTRMHAHRLRCKMATLPDISFSSTSSAPAALRNSHICQIEHFEIPEFQNPASAAATSSETLRVMARSVSTGWAPGYEGISHASATCKPRTPRTVATPSDAHETSAHVLAKWLAKDEHARLISR